MKPTELKAFMKKYDLDVETLAQLIGLSPSAVQHWLSGIRSIAKPYGRLMRLFDKYPELMQDFK